MPSPAQAVSRCTLLHIMPFDLITGVGIDIVELEDMRKARFKKRVAEYFLTKKEIRTMPHGARRTQFLASRFALKEAVIKAFPKKISPLDFEIIKKENRPHIVFMSPQRNKKYVVLVSLTHTVHIAAAIAIVYVV